MNYFSLCNGIPLHVADEGKGDNVILFLHGYLETLYIWEDFTRLFGPEYRVISIDLPGHGLSGSHPQVNSLSFCAAAINQLMDKLNIGKFTIAGHSMGGYVAVQYASEFYERLKSLVLIHSVPFADTEQKKNEREAEIKIIESGKITEIIKSSIPKCYAPENTIRFKNKIEETIEIADCHDPLGIISSLKGMIARPDNSSVIKNPKVPVLMFFGRKDNFISNEKALAAMEQFPGISSVILENSGHNGFIEEPDAVLNAIENFLKRL